jgi:hypothetical protein
VAERPPFPFVVGSIRSGTTLLRLMLDAHPDLVIPPESYHVALLLDRRARYRHDDGVDLGLMARDLLTDQRLNWFYDWGIPRSVLESRFAGVEPLSFADAIRRLYGLCAEAAGKPRYGDKTPIFVLRMPKFAALLPEARFLHVIRDGRDVALSVAELRHPDHPRTLAASADQWATWIRRGRAAGQRLGAGRYQEIRYEELVKGPDAVLRRVCDFLGLDYRDELLSYVEHGLQRVPPRQRWQHDNLLRAPTPSLRDWRRDMSRRALVTFEAVAGDMLDELGYERAVRHIPWPDRVRAEIGRGVRGGRRVATALAHRARTPTAAVAHTARRVRGTLAPR